jgi:hypothetical protein
LLIWTALEIIGARGILQGGQEFGKDGKYGNRRHASSEELARRVAPLGRDYYQPKYSKKGKATQKSGFSIKGYEVLRNK